MTHTTHQQKLDEIVKKQISYYAYKLKKFPLLQHEPIEDLTQKLWCEILPYLQEYKEEQSSLITFVSSILENRTENIKKKLFRKKRYSPAVVSLHDNINLSDHENEIAQFLLAIDIERLLVQLPHNKRYLCLLLLHFQIAQIAYIQGCSRQQVRRNINKLRASFQHIVCDEVQQCQ